MIELRQEFKDRDAWSQSHLKEAFEFKNKKAPVIIHDCNYWTFGDLQKDIPEGYYGDDPSVSMHYQLEKIQKHYGYYTDDCYQGFLHPWFGTGVLASGFGTEIVFNYKADPAVSMSKIKHIDELKELKLPDPEKDGIMPMVLRSLDYYKQHCDLPVGITDCQGPLTTALSIIGYENFCYWIYDHPRQMQEFMELVTEGLIGWVKFQKERVGAEMEGCSYPLGVKVPDGFGGVWLSDDDSVIVSADIFKKFVVPFNSKVLKAFGGGCIHYCGNATQHIENYCNTDGLTSINNLHLDNIEAAVKMKNALNKKGVVYMACDFVPSDKRLESYYRQLFDAMGGHAGLIVVSYVAPAVELDHGKYEQSERNQFELGKKVKDVINSAING
jgi:hypothetical protein